MQGDSITTVMEAFKRQVETRGDADFLGVRQRTGTNEDGKPIMGDYQWETYQDVDTEVSNLGSGIMNLQMCPEVEAEQRMWRFVGIWALNRPEWLKTQLACMHHKITTVGFYDAMGIQQVEFILNQTEMTTIFCTSNYAAKILDMQSSGKAKKIKNIVLIGSEGNVDAYLKDLAQTRGTTLQTYEQVIISGLDINVR